MKRFILLLTMLAALLVVVSGCGSSDTQKTPPTPTLSPEEFKASCTKLDFRILDKNPDTWKGTNVTYIGRVAQIIEGKDSTDMRMNITELDFENWIDTIWVHYPGLTSALEDSLIQIWGTVIGKYTYTSQAGWEITLPLVIAKYVNVRWQ